MSVISGMFAHVKMDVPSVSAHNSLSKQKQARRLNRQQARRLEKLLLLRVLTQNLDLVSHQVDLWDRVHGTLALQVVDTCQTCTRTGDRIL